jgi:hypothetical protein
MGCWKKQLVEKDLICLTMQYHNFFIQKNLFKKDDVQETILARPYPFGYQKSFIYSICG